MNCLAPRGNPSISRRLLGRQGRADALDAQPFAHLGRQLGMPRRVLQDAAHPLGQEGRERQAAAAIGRHLGIAAGRGRALGDQFLDALEAQHAAGEDEGVARHQALDEGLLDLAQDGAAPQLHLDQRQLDDGADIHAELPRHQGRGQHPAAVGQLLQPVPALVGRQRVAAGGDEVEGVVEVLARQVAVGLRASAPPRRAGRGRSAGRRRSRRCAGPARRGRAAAADRRRARAPRRLRGRPAIPAPRSGWPARSWRGWARPAGGWRGRSAASGGSRPWARPSGSPGRRRPSRCRDRARRSPPRRAACRRPSPPRPCGAARRRASRDAGRSPGSPR